MRCKSGEHSWSTQENADKCCNGFRRELVLGEDLTGCDFKFVSPEGVRYGFKWVFEPKKKRKDAAAKRRTDSDSNERGAA